MVDAGGGPALRCGAAAVGRKQLSSAIATETFARRGRGSALGTYGGF